MDQSPVFTSANSLSVPIGQPFTFNVTASGYPAPTFSESGTLPTGVSFAGSTLSGTPGANTAGSYPVSFTATNGVAPDATQNPFTLTVTCPTISIAPALLPAGSYQQSYDSGAYVASGGAAPYTYTVNGTLPGVSMNSGSGHITGTPNNTGTFPFTVTATDNYGCTGTSATLSLNVDPVVQNDAYGPIIGNVKVDSTSGTVFSVTDNDQFPAGATISPTSISSTSGGSVTLTGSGANLGQFVYDPPVGYSGTDTFNYTLTSNGRSKTGTVTFTVSAHPIWFINSAGGACPATPCDGRLSHPFTDVGAANAVNGDAAAGHPKDGDHFFVYTGTYTGGMVLRASQTLDGAAALAPLSTLTGLTPANGQALPATGGSAPVLTNVGATVLTVNTNNTVRGLTLGNGSTALSGTGFGTLNMSSNMTINTNGQAMSLTNGTLNALLLGVTSTSGANNVSLVQVSGTANFGSGALSGALGTSLAIGTASANSGGNASIAYGGSITQTTSGQAPVVIQNSAAPGLTVTLSGAVTATAAGVRGISLTNNPGSSITFSGPITLTTTSNDAFTASTSGTVYASDTTSVLSTTTGIALNVSNTTIGSTGLHFKSISAGTAASGPTSGITLTNTGTSGSLVVSGSGSAGSGGTIQKATGAGISMTSTTGVSLSYMDIVNSTHDGVFGVGVNGFTLNNSTVTNNGTVQSGNTNDSGINLRDTTGAVVLGSDNVSSNYVSNVFLNNCNGTAYCGALSSASISSLTVTGGSYNNALHGTSFLVQGYGTSSLGTGTISGATFSGNASYAIDLVTQDNSTIGNSSGVAPAGAVTITGSTFTNNGGVGVSFANGGGSGAANMYVRFVNNTMNNTMSHAVNVVSGAGTTGGTLKALIDSNHIGTAGVPDSGSKLGEGIVVTQQGKNVGTVTITNNVIRALDNGAGEFGARGIDVQSLGPTATGLPATPFDVKIAGNDVDAQYTGSFPLYAIYLGVDDQGSPTTMHAEVHNNTVPTPAGGPCDTQCGATIGNIFYDRVATAGSTSTGTLLNVGGNPDVSTEIANKNTGTAGKTCAVDLTDLTLTSTPVNTVP